MRILRTRHIIIPALVVMLLIPIIRVGHLDRISKVYIEDKSIHPTKLLRVRDETGNLSDKGIVEILTNISITKPPVLYDIDKDGIYEVLVPSNYTLIAYKYNITSQNLSEIWRISLSRVYNITIWPKPMNKTETYTIETSPVCADFDGDGNIEIAIGAGTKIFFINSSGGLIREFELNKTPVELTVMDIDFDGALEAIIKTQTKELYAVDIFSFNGRIDEVKFGGEVIKSDRRILIARFPRKVGRQPFLWLTTVSGDYMIFKTFNESFRRGLRAKVYATPAPGNYSLNSSVAGTEFILIFKKEVAFVIISAEKTYEPHLYINSTQLFNASPKNILVEPLVADFDNDSYDEAFIWLRYNKTLSVIGFVGISNITEKSPETYLLRTRVVNATPISSVVGEFDGNTSAIILLSNGSIWRFYMWNESVIIEDLSYVENASYILSGDIDNDTFSELLVVLNDSIAMLDTNITGDWVHPYHDAHNTNNYDCLLYTSPSPRDRG